MQARHTGFCQALFLGFLIGLLGSVEARRLDQHAATLDQGRDLQLNGQSATTGGARVAVTPVPTSSGGASIEAKVVAQAYCPGSPPCSGNGECDDETRKCTCSSGKTGADCSINVNDYRTVVLGCGPILPAPVAAVCRKATESGGPCKAYSLLAAEECVEICPFIQGGNCSVASREHVCTRNKVKCSGMCEAVLSWFCDNTPADIVKQLAGEVPSATSEDASPASGDMSAVPA